MSGDCTVTHAQASYGTDGLVLAAIIRLPSGEVGTATFTMKPSDPASVVAFFKQMVAFGLGDAFFRTIPTNKQLVEALVGRTGKIL